mgnify:CR=1 FL=1
MEFVQIDIEVKIKAVIIPETLSEKLKYFFWEQKVIYEVLKDFDIELSTKEIITIEKGFTTDLCSVPPFLHSFLSNCPDNVKAYILHDWLYKNDWKRKEYGDTKAKKEADKEMIILANKLNKNIKINNKIRYLAVKYFGKNIFKRVKE